MKKGLKALPILLVLLILLIFVTLAFTLWALKTPDEGLWAEGALTGDETYLVEQHKGWIRLRPQQEYLGSVITEFKRVIMQQQSTHTNRMQRPFICLMIISGA